jgi:TRAP-type C4-dicarboxylate transport system permease small subunit
VSALKRFKWLLDKSLEAVVTVAMIALLLDVVWQVFSRFLMPTPSAWTEALAIYLLIWVGLLGGSVALNRGAHLGIDYFVLKLPPRKRLYAECFAYTIVFLFSLLVMTVGGFMLVRDILYLGQTSSAIPSLKMGYVYMALPISGLFLTLYSLEFLLERIVMIRRGELPSMPPHEEAEHAGEQVD